MPIGIPFIETVSRLGNALKGTAQPVRSPAHEEITIPTSIHKAFGCATGG